MGQHCSVEAPINLKHFHLTGSRNPVGLLMIFCLVSLLTGCFNRSQPATNTPDSGSPTPTNSSSPPLPPSPPITSPTSTPQASPSSQNGNQSGAVKEIEARLNKTVSGATGVSIQSLTCPPGVEVKVGSRFDCTAVSDGQSFAIAVEITNASGPQFQWSTKGLLVLSKLEQFIQKQIKDKNGLAVTADCGGSIRVAKPGETFECKVSDPQGQTRPAQIIVKDDQGTVDVTLM
ncbi:MAG: DUF4333 domain-containing protein [Kovacikia sp.]